jgi:hypothetical protein
MSEKKKEEHGESHDGKNKAAHPITVNGKYGLGPSGEDIVEIENHDADARRPDDNELPGTTALLSVANLLDEAKLILERYAQHLRPLDRKRRNGVGIKKLGFIETSYDLAKGNTEFLPHWLGMDKYTLDNDRLNNLKLINSVAKQVEEFLWNVTMESADILYTDSLEFYSSVKDAAKRRVDAAEALFNTLSPFFKSRGAWSEDEEEAPTEEELKRDFNAYLHGKRDGEITVRNVKPKIQAGEHEVIDKKFSGSEQIKETKEAEIKE